MKACIAGIIPSLFVGSDLKLNGRRVAHVDTETLFCFRSQRKPSIFPTLFFTTTREIPNLPPPSDLNSGEVRDEAWNKPRWSDDCHLGRVFGTYSVYCWKRNTPKNLFYLYLLPGKEKYPNGWDKRVEFSVVLEEEFISFSRYSDLGMSGICPKKRAPGLRAGWDGGSWTAIGSWMFAFWRTLYSDATCNKPLDTKQLKLSSHREKELNKPICTGTFHFLLPESGTRDFKQTMNILDSKLWNRALKIFIIIFGDFGVCRVMLKCSMTAEGRDHLVYHVVVFKHLP